MRMGGDEDAIVEEPKIRENVGVQAGTRMMPLPT
jgi:hypothetical protein